MDSNRVTIAALLFIVAIIVINYVMFVVARSWAKGGGESRWMAAIRKSLSNSMESSSSKSMNELRQKMEELQGKDKEA